MIEITFNDGHIESFSGTNWYINWDVLQIAQGEPPWDDFIIISLESIRRVRVIR